MSQRFLLGVLGGMGPLATLDFLQALLEACSAATDQQQIPTVVWNVPQIPDRQAALAGRGPSPLPALLHGIRQLNQAGASHIAIPCNTAHHWYQALCDASRAPVLHIAHTALAAIAAGHPPGAVIGIIATAGTLQAGWYQQGLRQLGMSALVPDDDALARWFVPGCYAVKRGDLCAGGVALSHQATQLFEQGASQLILACTEVPLALRAVNAPFMARTLDPTRQLARHCAQLWQEARHQ